MSDEPLSPRDEQLRLFDPLIEQIVFRWRQGRDDDFAEDLRQTARIACWRALESYDARRSKSLLNYTYCCAVRAVRHAVRAYRRSHENLLTLEEPIPNGRALPSEYEQQVENVEHWSPEIFLDCLGHEDLYLVCQRLQSRDKKILACFYGGQERDEQIAARLGMQPSTVKKRRQRAVQYLRQYMLGTENIPHRRSRKR